MPQPKLFVLYMSTATLFMGAPALAELTAQELWAEWQSFNETIGQQVEAASVQETGSGLTISGVTSTAIQQGVTSTSSIDEITMTENGDGTVSVAFSDTYTIITSAEVSSSGGLPPKAGDAPLPLPNAAAADLEMTISGMSSATMTVSQDGDDRLYDYDAPLLVLTMAPLDGPQGIEEDITLSMNMTNSTAQYRLSDAQSETAELGFSGTTQALSGALSVIGGGTNISFNFAVQDLSNEGEIDMESYARFAQFDPNVVPENLMMRLDGSYASGSYQMLVLDGGTTLTSNGSNEGGDVTMAFADGGMQLGMSTQSPSIQMSGSDLPAPISVSAASSEFSLTLPIEALPEPNEMALRIDYQDLILGDDLWDAFDPGRNIPRDPATLTVDLTGEVQMFQSLLAIDPETMQGPPGELRSAQLNELTLSVAGASLAGAGQVVFTPGQLVPMPIGQIDLTASGLFGLLDRLTAAGFLPAEQAAMARGVSAMFASPGAGPDTLESTIEFTQDGGITANGFPLR